MSEQLVSAARRASSIRSIVPSLMLALAVAGAIPASGGVVSTNLLLNPNFSDDFDSNSIPDNWSGGTSDPLDHTGDGFYSLKGTNSATFPSATAVATQCVDLSTPAAGYHFGGFIYVPSTNIEPGSALINLQFIDGPFCDGVTLPAGNFNTPAVTAPDTWTETKTRNVATPVGTQSALVQLFVTKDTSMGTFSAHFDDVFLSSAEANLSVMQFDDPDPTAVNDSAHYFVTVTNNGPSDATNVVLTDTAPAGTSLFFVSDPSCSGTTTVVCNLGTMAPFESRDITFSFFAPSTPGTITNTVSVTADEPDPIPATSSEPTEVKPLVDFTVDSTVDAPDANPGDGICATSTLECTLRAAVQEANAYPGPSTITLPSGTYTLTLAGASEDSAATGDLDTLERLTIVGAGAGTTIIDGNAGDRLFDLFPVTYGTPPPSKFSSSGAPINAIAFSRSADGEISRSVLEVSISSISTITSFPLLHLIDVTLRNGAAPDGGAVRISGTVVLQNSVVANNVATNDGGALFMEPTSGLDVLGSTIEGNTAGLFGGAIAMRSNWGVPGLTIDHSTIRNNTTAANGGAIHSAGSDPIAVTNSTLSGNQASGGDGGGLYLGGSGSALIDNSTLSGNAALFNGGGVVASVAPLSILNSTFAENSAGSNGGAIHSGGAVDAVNAIFANSTSGGNCSGNTFGSGGNNLSSDSSCGFSGSGNLTLTDPLLGPLQNNGGQTDTHALLSGSPAIDAGDDAAADGVDQRGFSRPVDGDQDGTATTDIGAFEYVPSADLSVTKTDSPDPVAAGQPLTYTITVTNTGPDDAVGVTADDLLPNGTTFVSVSPSQGSCTVSAMISCSLGTILASGNATVSLTIVPNAAGSIVNTVFVASGTTDPVPANDSASAVTLVQAAPVANDDAFSTNEDTALTVPVPGVLGNDTDADSTTVTATLVSGTSNGTLVLNADGSFTYTPNSEFSGSDSFTYKASDGTNVSNVATVTIDVLPVDDPPVAVADSATADSGASVSINVLANDFDADSSTLTLSSNTTPSNGAVSCSSTGVCTYTSNAGFSGTDSFTYTVTDGTSFDTATVTITVSDPCPNDVPPLLAPANGATELESPVTFQWRAVADAIGYDLFLLHEGAVWTLAESVAGGQPAGTL
ncbi:MAG: Ig-like domain-containing protein, partial [Thermoanaerobaculia bacterium]